MRQESVEKKFEIGDLFAFFSNDIIALESKMAQEIQSAIPLIPEVSQYIIASGGKRLRPLIAMAAARLCGYEGDRHIDLATTIEFIHTATLLHDDVVDESRMRRGLESANQKWGNKASILIGDFLFSRALNIMTRIGTLEMIQKLSHSSMVLAEGEVFQLSSSYSLDLTVDDYFKIIKAKTACLFETAATLGAKLANADDKTCEALSKYGENIGIAFQIIDDLIDYEGNTQTIGKSIGDDFMEGKVTLPVILCYEKADEGEKEFWRRIFDDRIIQNDDFIKAQEYLSLKNIKKAIITIASSFAKEAEKSLSVLPNSSLNKQLSDLALSITNRVY